jgi:hypothetical protein
MRHLFLVLYALWYTIPGIATLVNILGVPQGWKYVFVGVAEALGVFALLVLCDIREKIRAIPSSKVIFCAVILIILFVVFITSYIWLFDLCVVHHDRGTVYFPIWLDGRIADMVNKSGGRPAAITKYGLDAVRQAIEQNASNSLGFTTIILFVIYQTMFTSLGVAFGLLGFHKKTVTLDKTDNKPIRRILVFCHKL